MKEFRRFIWEKRGRKMLKVSDVVTNYGDIEVLHGISLDVAEGEIVALIGANGAGKSTLLKTISGLIHPSKGRIEFLGQRIDGFIPERIVQLGVAQIPEGRNIFPLHTVETNLEMGAYIRNDKEGIKRDKEYFFNKFPVLKQMRKKLAGLLSGGEQQMLAISRALMSNPKLILMDEPSMGLAPVLVHEIFDTIVELHKDRRTIFLVEQNAKRALCVSERGYVLETGRVVLYGESDKLLCDEGVRKAYLGEE
jgi:branched-chain amino acid transport system ATP-binding protein